jgi:RNA polymerase sigma factor (sigma-70 family)
MRLSSEQLERKLLTATDAELLKLTPRTPEAFSVFYDRHLRAILSFLLSRTGNIDVAEELTCEVFASTFINVRTYDPKRGDGRAWLFGIAKVTLLKSYRQHAIDQSARRKLGMTIHQPTDEAWERAERRLDSTWPGLQPALRRLTESERTAVEARVVHEREYADIARSENTSEEAIRKRVSRGLKKLGELKRRKPQ